VSRRKVGWSPRFDVGIALLAATTTAFATLVLEDAFALGGTESQFDGPRWGGTLASAFLLAVLVRGRQRRVRTTGTLYYLRYLQEWMSDWHLDDLDVIRSTYLDRRVIGRWSTEAPKNGVLDLVEDTAAITSELQRSFNDDRADTAFNIAPNLLLPVAIGVGFDLYGWDSIILEELFGDKLLSWALTDAAGAGTHAMPVTLVADRHPNGTSVLVTADLTDQGATSPPPWRFRTHYRVGVFTGPGLVQPQKVVVSTQQRPVYPLDTVVVHPARAAKAVVGAIRRALHENPASTVVLAARMPKTVALAVGWGLANWTTREHPGCGQMGCRQVACLHPWRRLVVAMPDQETLGGGYHLTRVHRSQPTAGQLVAAVSGTP
jgi:hypothetical protein